MQVTTQMITIHDIIITEFYINITNFKQIVLDYVNVHFHQDCVWHSVNLCIYNQTLTLTAHVTFLLTLPARVIIAESVVH